MVDRPRQKTAVLSLDIQSKQYVFELKMKPSVNAQKAASIALAGQKCQEAAAQEEVSEVL